MQTDIHELIKQMTLEEKASLCSGMNFWHTREIEKHGIPSMMMADGPHGLRKQEEGADHLGITDSVPAICFPSAAGLASSWNRHLIEKVGTALGEQSQAEGISVLLGPGVNIKRSPLCGRNFEYFSEDPYLSSEMAASYINGVQSQGVGTSPKHFAVNNQEHRRMTTDAIVDERALREIYLASFEGAVKKAQPWTVMSSYNRVNGTYASENHYLLEDILREEWGFDGFVVSDWGAVNERVDGLQTGLELEMPPGSGIGDQKIVDAVKNGELAEETLNTAVERFLKIIFKAGEQKKENASYNREVHHQLARETARESMVLLKNEGDILPLNKKGKLAVIGAFAKEPRYQGSGSSYVNPTTLETGYEEIKKKIGEESAVLYAQGYRPNNDDVDEALLQEAREAAHQSDKAVIFAGLPGSYESEGFDRKHLRMPENQRKVIEAVAEAQPNLVVVLHNGAPIEMPWMDQTKGVLEAYLGGEAGGGAIADLLFGDANPSGKLAETFPLKLSDNPSYLNFPGEGDKVEYKEGLFIGYRYYDTKDVETLFPFGYGLSYTTFEYRDLSISKTDIQDTETVTVQLKVKNTGKVTGKEIVQLYVSDVESSVIRPEKELKGFEKVDLDPGEEKTVTFTLDHRAFAYYHVDLQDWHVESGAFDILVGKSSCDIPLKQTIQVTTDVTIPKTYHRNSTIGDLVRDPKAAPVIEKLRTIFQAFIQDMDDPEEGDMASAMIENVPLRALISFSKGAFTEELLEEILKQLNET